MLQALLPILALACGQDPSGFEPEDLSPAGQRAFRYLVGLEHFHDGTSGFDRRPPAEVQAMRWLWLEARAAEAFHALLARDSRASELYGLVGLYYADPEAFAAEVEMYRRLRGVVPLMSSCTYDERHPVSRLVAITDGEVVRLDSRAQTTKEWAEKYGKQSSGYRLDILGGGTPCLYRFGGGGRELAPLRLPPAPEDDPTFTPEELSDPGRRAHEILHESQRFTDAAIGYGGVTPVEVKALRWLWQEPRAAQAFHALLRDPETSIGCKLYALCGLYDTHPRCFREEAFVLAQSEATVPYQSGCIVHPEHSVARLVRREQEGAVRLEPGQSVKEWAAENAPPGGFRYDIFGGGFPDLFRHGGGWHEVELEPLPD